MVDTRYLIPAVVQQESGGNPNALSPKGAAGLMQIMPETAKNPGFGVVPLQGWDGLDPRTAPIEEQIRFGNDYLGALTNNFGGDVRMALAAYNAGPSKVAQYGGVPPYKETQDYVAKVTANAPKASDWRSRAEPAQAAQASDWRSRAQPTQPPAPQPPQASDWRSRAEPPAGDLGPIAAGIQGFNSALPFGERISAGLGALGATAYDKVTGTPDGGVAGNYAQIREMQRVTREESPLAYGAGMGAGIVNSLLIGAGKALPGAATGVRGAIDEIPTALSSVRGWVRGKEVAEGAGTLAKIGNVAGKAVRGGVAAAPVGAAYGYGASEHDLDTKEALGDAATGAAIAGGIGAVLPVAGAAIGAVKGGPKIGELAEQMKSKAGEAFKQAEELGGKFAPEEVSNPFRRELQALKPKPINGSVMTSEEQKLAAHLSEYDGLTGAKLSLDDVKRLDEGLTQKINSFVDARTGQPDAMGRKLMVLQTKLRNIVAAVPENAGNDALSNGRKLWRAQIMLNDLDTIAERANMTQNVSTSLRTGYRNLLMDKDRIRGWPEAAKELLRKAATPSATDDVIQLVSSRLPAIIMGGTGNIGGAATAHLVGAAGRGVGAGLAAQRGARVQGEIVKQTMRGLREVKVPDRSNMPQLLLAPPENMSRLPMTDKQVNISRKLMEQPTPGPDLSGGAVRPQPSRILQTEESANWIQGKQFKNLSAQFRNSEISQNQFVKTAKKSFGLTETQARQLAKEVQTYGGF